MNHAIRVSLPYDDCKHIVRQWADRSVSAIVYEHTADDEISRTHIHIGLYGCEVKSEALKRIWADAPGKGNEFWSWKEATPDPSKYITYMSKGNLAYVYNKNIPDEQVERFRQLWAEPVKADKPDNSDKIITKIYNEMRETLRFYAYPEDDYDHLHQLWKYDMERLLEACRTRSFKYLYGLHRIVPHASHYKIIAASVFMRIGEELKLEDRAVELLKNLWY